MNTQLFIIKKLDKESLYCCSNPGSNMWAGGHPNTWSQFFRYLDCIHVLLGLITFCGFCLSFCACKMHY